MAIKIPIISVIMSAYNETKEELEKSISSILQQSYADFEFIIINDNPDNLELKKILNFVDDKRVRIINNEENIGLVESLNKGLKFARGLYIARMDADDISLPKRLQDQILYIQKYKFDMIGSYIELINENDKTIKKVMKFPLSHKQIKRFIRWGNCISHPTWLVKKEVYMKLNGYRNVLYCEDYDFILRAIANGYKVGNLPKVELRYRVRENGVSKSNAVNQYLLRDYLSKNIRNINNIIEKGIIEYLNSKEFQIEKFYLMQYKQNKVVLKQNCVHGKIQVVKKMICNHYFWKDLLEKIMLWIREH